MTKKQKLSTLLVAIFFAAVIPGSSSNAAPVTTTTFGNLTIQLAGFGAGTPNTLISGDGSFNDPWLLDASGGVSAELQFSGDTVTNCVTPVNYNADFVLDPFTSGDTECSFTIAVPGQSYGIRVQVSNGYSTYYVRKQGTVAPSQQGGQNSQIQQRPAPAKYEGPEFTGLASMKVLAGQSPKLEGEKLDEITSIEIGGKAVTFKASSDTSLDLSVPEGLAPGLYDMVIQSSAGKLTHLSAFMVEEPRETKSLTSRVLGELSEETITQHLAFASNQAEYINRIRCVVNGADLAHARQQAITLCAKIVAANPEFKTSIVEAKSTVTGNHLFARVVYGWRK